MTFRSIIADYVLGGNLNNLYNLTGSFLLYGTSPPAAGSLVGSISPKAGTDNFGNPYPAGFQFVDSPLKIQMTVSTFLGTLAPLLQLYTGAGDEALPFHVIVAQAASGGPYIAQMVSPANSVVQDAAGLQLISGDNTSVNAVGQAFYDSGFVLGNGTRMFMIRWGAGGVTLSPVAAMVSLQPGTGGSIGNLPAAEIWHTLSLNAGFQALPGFPAPRYQVETVNGSRTRLAGAVQLTATKAQGTPFAVLPPAYAPVVGPKYYLTANSLSGGSGQTESLHVQTNGNLELGHSGVSGNYLFLDDVAFELD